MPRVAAADVVVVTTVKVQRYKSNPLSLITNNHTSIRVYSSSKIPKPPLPAHAALLSPRQTREARAASAQEQVYVSYLYHKINKDVVDKDQFNDRAARSLNVKNKFSLLRDVEEGRFYDLIAHVATDPYIGMDMATLYVSDYTENPNFHPCIWDGYLESGVGVGDPYGYVDDEDVPRKKWVGPYGKMSIQITCFEPHASALRSVVAGQWVSLRNVQIKYGRDGRYLEGFLREDRGYDATRVNVAVLEISDRDTIDPRLKDAIRRCRDYIAKKRKQIKDIKAAQAAGQKRKASLSTEPDKPPSNSKERRKQKRAALERREREKRMNENLRLGLNDQVTCEAHDAPYSSIETILAPPLYNTAIDGEAVSLAVPFTCAKYRARARVVDFYPPALEDFACSRKHPEFDVLSDNEDASDSASDQDTPTPDAARIWEWRFALQLEDAAPPKASTATSTTTDSNNKSTPRLWVLVNNAEAQCLTDLDATDLREDPDTLARLRERMSVLWGDLEERKKARAAAAGEGEGMKKTNKRSEYKDRAPLRRAGPGGNVLLRLERPPLDSSDAEDDGAGGDGTVREDAAEAAVSNKPFVCCIQQYGVYDRHGGGDGGRWVRCFQLFGTKICYS